MKRKLFGSLYFLTFGVFAYLQFNDPDPVFWIAVYASLSLSALLHVIGISHTRVFQVISLILVAISCFYITGFVEYLSQPNKNEIIGEMVYQKSYIEETREFIGLWIAATASFHLSKT
ncbi:hypothetical protein BFP72_05160 [Reichenbachiella sp. 5M10]|uniref:transmembrane 220 family protein n=1 Tax=Reichenbachiella sp. 5M10 TaxID=1889772 RepID=UPI000C15D614|nr:transmembrane 220 family protein [Reichenbachiella sp. 5M10]PIB34835.1 hypothetical protein BFP72_05160 [Reichenbachiella sp. 5M10]